MALSIDRLKAEISKALMRVPAGRVVTHATLGERWNVPPRLIAHVVAALSDKDRQSAPWHRVVASGGAIGRHSLRDEQIAKLKAEGVPVAPAGIVHELVERAVQDLDNPGPALAPRTGSGAPSRSRGMKAGTIAPRKSNT